MAALRRCLSPLGAHPGNFTQPFAWRRLIATSTTVGLLRSAATMMLTCVVTLVPAMCSSVRG